MLSAKKVSPTKDAVDGYNVLLLRLGKNDERWIAASFRI